MELNDLRKSPLFKGLSDDELQRLVDQAETISLQNGDKLIRQGDMGDSAYVVLDGEFEVEKQAGESMIRIGLRNPGDVVGEMALLSSIPRNATVFAKTNGRALRIPKEAFENLLSSSASASNAVLHWVIARLSQNEALLHQQEKMAALGTLSAGLAHELNNPAAAAQRSAAELSRTLLKWQTLTLQLGAQAYKEGHADWFDGFVQNTMKRLESPVKLSALDKIDLVEQLQEWLEANGIESAWEVAPVLVNFGWTVETLAELKTSALFNLSIQWLAAGCAMMSLTSETREAAERLSKLVGAMKTYTHLDQAPVLEVDLHDGLEDTLIILQHKIKQGITIRREYSSDLPRIEAYASELNQVWTNIIDNAIDAMNGKGEIVLKTYAQDNQVIVEIMDNGPGIPEHVRPRILEPFFTTKPPGKGTGLGLHISHDIVANRHHGQLLVESQPGRTKFKVMLPVRINKS